MEFIRSEYPALTAGVDEAGRGPLAGPVVAAAVILDPNKPIAGLKDSKKLSEKKRDLLFEEIKKHALFYAISSSNCAEIDEINILQASLLAMKRAVEQLDIAPLQVLVDGNQCPKLTVPCKAIVKGDDIVEEIKAASILAKVYRDRQMLVMDERLPQYGFARHKGYPTKMHLEALKEFGPSKEHRLTFAPVRRLIEAKNLL